MSNTVKNDVPEKAIEPPSLEMDLGYSIAEAKPSLKLKFSFGTISSKKKYDPFSLPLRKWWVSWKGGRDGKKGIVRKEIEYTSYEENILRERHKRIHDVEAMAEHDLSDARKALEDLNVGRFVSSETAEKVRNQSNGWLRLFKEALFQAKTNAESAREKCIEAENSLKDFVDEKKLHGKEISSKVSLWDRSAALVGLVLLEAIISLPPVAEKQGGGVLVMSFLLPLTVSVANALIGIVTGKIGVYTFLQSENPKFRIAALSGCIISLFVALWMNLNVGRWRESQEFALSLDGIFPTTAFSVVLFVIGMCVYIFSVYKGVRDFSDGFPGHEEKWNEFSKAKIEHDAWKGRYLFLIHEMRKSSQDKLDYVRKQISVVKSEYQQRINCAEKIIIELQKIEKLLPGLNENINSSARILLKEYRESAYNKMKDKSDSIIGSGEYAWETALPNIAVARERADKLLTDLKSNLDELSLFEEIFEKEIAAKINREIEVVSSEVESYEPNVIAERIA